MSSLNNKKRKSRSTYTQLIESFVHCHICNSDIPVKGERDERRVLRGHQASSCHCTTSKSTPTSSLSKQQQNESNVDDVNIENGYETYDNNSGALIDDPIDDPLKPDHFSLLVSSVHITAYSINFILNSQSPHGQETHEWID